MTSVAHHCVLFLLQVPLTLASVLLSAVLLLIRSRRRFTQLLARVPLDCWVLCAPALFQRVIIDCVDEPADVEAYVPWNRRSSGPMASPSHYEYIQPDSAFYLWVRALVEMLKHFCDVGQQFELLPVPSGNCFIACRLAARELLRCVPDLWTRLPPGKDSAAMKWVRM